MLDRDLAQLYGVGTRALNQAVRGNIDRFPEDFMFRLTREEIMRISQFVISSAHRGVRTLKFSKNVMAFTEHGVAMLSSVLKEIYLDCDGNTLLLKVDQKGGRPVIRVSGVASTSGLKEESGKLKERKSLFS